MYFEQDALEKAQNIKMLILDVDGVLTDGSIAIGEKGELFKSFNVRDGLGITIAQKYGIKTAIITGRQSSMLEFRARELGISEYYQNCKSKMTALKEIMDKYHLNVDEIAYVGDDLFDLPIMKKVGLPASVADGSYEAKKIAKFISDYDGGRGAVRQLIEFVLQAQGKWQQIVEEYMNDDASIISISQ